MSWTLHPLQGSLGEHATAWDTLRRRLFAPNPMLSSRFVNALLGNFATGGEYLCVLTLEDQVEGMCVVQQHGSFSWRSFLPEQAQLGPTLLHDASHVEDLVRSLPGLAAELDLLCCDPHFGDLASTGLFSSDSVDQALTMDIALTGSFDDYWRSRPKKLTQNLERYRRRAQADGLSERFVTITEPEQIATAVARYAALEAAGWKGSRGTAVGSSPVQERFYRDVMCQHAKDGLAVAWELWLDDQLVAARLAIIEDRMLVMLKTTYLESAASYAPGRVLLRLAIEHCFGLLPEGRIEFYTDASDEQLKWSSGHRWIRHLGFYRNAVARTTARATRSGLRLIRGSRARGDATGPVGVRCYRHPSEFPAELVRFLTEAEDDSMQFGVGWYTNLVDQVFPEHAGVMFYVLEHDGRPMAVLPLLLTARTLDAKVQSLANYYTALYAPVLAPGLTDVQLSTLIRAIQRDHRGLSSFQFFPMAIEAASFRTLQSALRLANLISFPYFCFGNWYLAQQESWAAYLAQRSSKQRNTISRMTKKLQADGGRVEIIIEDDIERGIAAYEVVYAASWKQPEPYLGFVPGLINFCRSRGWLRLGVVWLGDKPIAAQIWIVANGRADIYKVAYDEGYKSYSPGTVLTAALMQHALDVDRVHEVDYLIGDDPYKQTWMSHRRERWGLVAYNPLSLIGLKDLCVEGCRRGIKALVLKLRAARPANADPHE
ncbi:GNAT family N-acetyltransferase [Pelomonas sp. SE-A7]|uniref:GNAT family N-acetyltransferase n=1 Tax=Pelomonas sp. SE-A7 TaxID=3054953 RepID=UPI00259CF17A|nr:GNAT family N-acetyltransferase [Pelomonas sp. SE-A7]MDM4764896.1 GNAT family N-acetyltransferase [Pelomonas sp. SE-A7]